MTTEERTSLRQNFKSCIPPLIQQKTKKQCEKGRFWDWFWREKKEKKKEEEKKRPAQCLTETGKAFQTCGSKQENLRKPCRFLLDLQVMVATVSKQMCMLYTHTFPGKRLTVKGQSKEERKTKQQADNYLQQLCYRKKNSVCCSISLSKNNGKAA